jgi:hypothetical protein
MSTITLIDDSEQSSLVTNGLAKNGEMYLKKAGSTDVGSIVVYDSGVWMTFANEYTDSLTFPTIQVFDNESDFINDTDADDYTIVHAKDTNKLYVWDGTEWVFYNNNI